MPKTRTIDFSANFRPFSLPSGPLRFGRQFILLSIATLLYTATVKAQNEVTVQLVGTDYGPSVEKQLIIRFCNDSDYTIVLECMTISHTLTWKSEIGYFEDITFIQMTGNFCLPILDNGFTFLLIQSDELDNGTAYISQLRVNTSTLEQAIPNSAGNMSVTCQARYDKKDIIFIRQSGTMLFFYYGSIREALYTSRKSFL